MQAIFLWAVAATVRTDEAEWAAGGGGGGGEQYRRKGRGRNCRLKGLGQWRGGKGGRRDWERDWWGRWQGGKGRRAGAGCEQREGGQGPWREERVYQNVNEESEDVDKDSEDMNEDSEEEVEHSTKKI